MNIRIKFAHLSEIKTFDDLFSKTRIGKEVKKNFHTWYFDEKGLTDIPEKITKKCLDIVSIFLCIIFLKFF